MSQLYKDNHRALQDEFGTRALADRVEEAIFATEFDDASRAYIGAVDFFFLATVDGEGQPTVSYKGGFLGFVKITGPSTLVFPNYDGNGMFLSMGNLAGTRKIAMLFIDFVKPSRMRLKGEASILRDSPLLAEYPEANFLVQVEVTGIWANCPRYVHRYERVESSRYVPEAGKQTPLAGWKRRADVQDVLRPEDAARAKEEGLLTGDEYTERMATGHPEA